jgi:aspartyl-tRNA synthetase
MMSCWAMLGSCRPITAQQRKEAGVDAKPEPQAKKAAAAEDVREDQGEQPSAPTEG